jgi:hypothetical protein
MLKNKKNKRGSLMIGILLMMLIISITSIAVINRSRQGAILATDSRKGYVAYQASDTDIEEILNKFRKLDSYVQTIPENFPIRYIDDDMSTVVFYGRNGTDKLSSTDSASEVYFIEKKGISQSTARKIRVQMLDRVRNPVKKFTLTKISSCNVIQLQMEYHPDAWEDVSKLEVMKSDSPDYSTSRSASWYKIESDKIRRNPSQVQAINDKNITTVFIVNGDFVSGRNYIALRAKNKNNFMLDSLSFPTDVTGILSYYVDCP